MAIGPLPLEAVAAAKSLAHWLTTGIPLTVLAPVLGLLVNLPLEAYGVLVATMLAGTPAVSFIGAIGAALTLRARRGGVLIALLMLPLYVPTLLFGIEAISAALTGSGGFVPAFLILVAISLASVVLAPLAAALALRFQLT
jgi:heme exporter protein B